MRSHYTIVEPQGVYFLTATIVEWIPALVGTDACEIIVSALRYCREHKGLHVYADVVMDRPQVLCLRSTPCHYSQGCEAQLRRQVRSQAQLGNEFSLWCFPGILVVFT